MAKLHLVAVLPECFSNIISLLKSHQRQVKQLCDYTGWCSHSASTGVQCDSLKHATLLLCKSQVITIVPLHSIIC